MSIIKLDGTRIKIIPPDYDGDGKTGGLETVQMGEKGIINAKEPTELGESLKELNDDSIDPITKMSGIDMRSRLMGYEISSLLAVDTLVSFSFLPIKCLQFTRQKKRLAVSLGGEGRKEIQGIVSGQREHLENQGTGLGSKLKGLFTPKG